MPTIEVVEFKDGWGFTDQSLERYGFNGTLEEYKKVYGFKNWRDQNIRAYWSAVYSKSWQLWREEEDRKERARIALEKLKWFLMAFKEIATVLTPGAGGTAGAIRPSYTKFSFVETKLKLEVALDQ